MSICRDCRKGAAYARLAEDKAALPLTREGARLNAEMFHRKCKGGTDCDCQHAIGTVLRPDRKPDPRRGG
jgi:hypothetical protein